MTGTDPVQVLAALFAGQGAADYFDEPVSQAGHMLQTAALAVAARAADHLVAAALLHDIGHFHGPHTGHDLLRGTDNRHGDTGADWLAQWFGSAVTEPVRLHVAAKRYLCATEPGYHARLSLASQRTLAVQGGPLTPSQTSSFAAHPFAGDAVALRRWDDLAKDPSADPPPLDDYTNLLYGLRVDP